jgi:glycyl-tRNA synthetase beta chain
MMQDFLFELGCEELPSAAVKSLSDALQAAISGLLQKHQLVHQAVLAYASPRRLAIYIKQLAAEQPEQTNQRRGPALAAAYDESGHPSKALIGFAQSCGVSPSDLETLETDKGSWLVFNQTIKGKPVQEVMPALFEEALSQLPIAKPMRWGAGDDSFVRPVHWLLMMYGGRVIPCQLFGVNADKFSHGHRFHAPQAIEIQSPETYEAQLHQAFVVVDFAKRQHMIHEQIHALAKKHHANAVMPQSLLDEVTSIVEWPVALCANFDLRFLEVPAEALIASMQSHQKSFALKKESGELINQFIFISNIESQDPKRVIEGNEKVMRARLSDAAFFFEQDQKHRLQDHITMTGHVVFQQQMGTLKDKAERIAKVMSIYAPRLGLSAEQVMRAAALSKCDLMTGMVGEFPELQGLMGYYYAKHDGEEEAVALALHEQYFPRFAADDLPQSSLGWLLSLADRIDTLVGIFLQGKKPTGMKDPFKCRRHALAIVRMLLAQPIHFSLNELISDAKASFENTIDSKESQLDQLKPFILDRLQSHLVAQHVTPHQVDAVLAVSNDDVYDVGQRMAALVTFVQSPACESLASASKRVGNILKQASVNQENINEKQLVEPAEKQLWQQLQVTQLECQKANRDKDYETALSHLAALKEPVDTFFDQVMVMVDEEAVKQNRLALLRQLQLNLQQVADISLLP